MGLKPDLDLSYVQYFDIGQREYRLWCDCLVDNDSFGGLKGYFSWHQPEIIYKDFDEEIMPYSIWK